MARTPSLAALARVAEPKLRQQILRALASLRAAVPEALLERIIASQDAFALHDLASTLPRRLQAATRTVERAFLSGARATAIRTSFASVDVFSVRAAQRAAGRFVTGVTAETRLAIRDVVVRAITDGTAPREAAKQIRPLIGLSRRQARAVVARRATLVRVGVKADVVRARMGRYSDKLLRFRAEMIARTEIMRAQNAGQHAAWAAAADRGEIGRQSRKTWIVANDDRLCPYCAPMDGVSVTLDEAFVTPLGSVDYPPLHPLCRCTTGLVPVRARRAA